MTTYVLIHGAFRGGWAWQRVRPLLVAAGHQVFAPSLLGCGELAAWADRVTGLDVWVDQVCALLEHEDLTEVVLVGHSQGGVIASAVAATAPHRIAHLAHLDAGVPQPGERAVDLSGGVADLPPRDTLIPARPLEATGDLDTATAAWASARLTPVPFAPSLDPAPTPLTPVPARFAFCARTPAGYPSQLTRARLDASGTAYDVLDTHHDAPLTRPDLVAQWLEQGVPA
ncbi:alpha/beta fold hydrolase [Nocardioides sp.]|uniref:alpha/beta hydrolase n=1 Tax=Nocardioides sp. TaxID=35761 RepID=UPI00356289E8